jgi:hypothetical protein
MIKLDNGCLFWAFNNTVHHDWNNARRWEHAANCYAAGAFIAMCNWHLCWSFKRKSKRIETRQQLYFCA